MSDTCKHTSGERSADATRELWTIGDFAHAHGVSVRAVYLLLERGVLEGRKVGRRTLVTEASRLAWLKGLPPFHSTAASKR
jgi:hypothetical protein